MVSLFNEVLQKHGSHPMLRALGRRNIDDHVFHLQKSFSDQEINSFIQLTAGLADVIYGLLGKNFKFEDIFHTLEMYDWQQLDVHSDHNLLLDNDLISEIPFQFFENYRMNFSMLLSSSFKKHRMDKSRITSFRHSGFKSSHIVLYKLGFDNNPDYSFGLSVVTPKEIDRFLWWTFTESPVRDEFSHPHDLDQSIWLIKNPEYPIKDRPWAKTIAGMQQSQSGSSLGGQIFSLIPFDRETVNKQGGQEMVNFEGSVLSFFRL